MQTRQLRLGDVVDDYCPRERRLSNHVIVAMVEDAIKQTRCSTCDFEHPYKDAKVPPKRKKKDAPSELFQQVLEGVMEGRTLARAAAGASAEPPAAATSQPGQPDAPAAPVPAPTRRRSARVSAVTEEPPAAPAPAAAPAPILRGVLRPAAAHATSQATTAVSHSTPPASESSSPLAASSDARTDSSVAATPASTPAPQPESTQTPVVSEDEGEGPLYRRNLIRATLPRPVGEAPVRQMPSFTIREAAAARPGKFRHKQRPQGMSVGPMTSSRQGRPNGVGGNQTRQAAGRGPQAGRPGGGKKGGGAPQHGNQSHGGKNRQGGQGNKRFK